MSTTPKFPPGWKMFPIKPNSKEPIFYGWAKEATDDLAQIESWHIQYPGCNWAVAAGPSGLAILDVDPPLGEESLFQLELELGLLPATRENRSARGGRHLIFRGEIAPTASKLGPKLDTRGGNSYILIPPSTFEGKPYVVLQDLPLAQIPEAYVSAAGTSREHVSASDSVVLDTGNAKARAEALITSYIAQGHVAREGQGGDATTFAVAAEVINLGLSPEAALEAMLPWNDASLPPWNIDELRVKIDNANQYSQNEVGAWYVPPVSDRIPAEALDKLIAENAAASVAPEREERSRFKWLSEDELKNLPPAQWLIKDKLMRDSLGMIYGPSGHYKSFLSLDLAAQVAQKGELAFYVASEGIRRMGHKDYPAWKLANGEERNIPIRMMKDMPIMSDDFDVGAFIRSIDAVARKEQRHVGIVILDTLNRAMVGLEENSASDMGKVVKVMEAIQKAFETTVIVVHHTPKSGEEPRGSNALYAAFDTVIKIISKHDTKLAQMFITKQRDEELPGHPFSFQGRRFGPGLAFLSLTDKDAAVLRDETDTYAPLKVSAALVALKAWKPVTVSTQVLVSHMVPQLENESPEDRNNSVARGLSAFKAALKSRPAGYAGYHDDAVGKAVKWSLPAPE